MKGTLSTRSRSLWVLGLTMSLLGCDAEAPTEPVPTPPSLVTCATLASECVGPTQGCIEATSAEDAYCGLCPQKEHPESTTRICKPIEGVMHEHDFGTLTLEAGEEFNGVCQSWVLNNPQEIWVNAVEFVSEGIYHHSNWFFVPEGKMDYPDGTWFGCYSEGFNELEAALYGGVLFAQSTQVLREVQKFPPGVAVRIPPYSRIISATHLLNYFPEARSSNLMLRIYETPPEDVTVKLTPFRLTYRDLHIPAESRSEFTSECDLDSMFQSTSDKPLDLKLYYALPHYHALGDDFRLSIYGGERDGEELLKLGSFTQDPFGRVFDPPIDLKGAKGLRFTCGFNNPTNQDVGWGIGDQEMCVMLGFAESTIAFDASVQKNSVQGPDENGIVQNTGACETAGFAFSQQKAGGSSSDE